MSSNTIRNGDRSTNGQGKHNALKPGTHKTPAVLLRALKVLRIYTGATGAKGCVLEQNGLPIPEMMEELLDDRNPCLFCIRHRSRAEQPVAPRDFTASPCHGLHCDAVKKASHYGGSYIYICEAGLMFWTCPVVRNGEFSGALIASGFTGIDVEESIRIMLSFAEGGADAEQVRAMMTAFPHAGADRVRALADILLTCAQSLSEAGEDYHETLRRRAMQQAVISEQLALLRRQYPEGGPMPGYPLDKERLLLSALRRGDNETGRKVLNELLGVLFYTNPDEFNYIRFRALELVVLLSRTAVSPGFGESAMLETNNRYLKQIQEVENIGELTDALHAIVENMAGQIFSFQGVRHAAALQKAERFIHENFTRKISLGEIAENSGLSAPYFSTIFREEMGENLSSYLNRLRVEKAGRLLTETNLNLADIAGSCGFEDQSWFSKIFKSFTGTSPGKYRNQGGSRNTGVSENSFAEDLRAGEGNGDRGNGD
ncbi:MAG: helix-turn-helix domain-containing protein [Spirochaetaceae bacterium]|jgi:AraC-like DNA-binding protein/ligand-binding sensor protein|nr:helix-turn-helix domain-containing protein [Spirochaetaceae bacterium]